MKLLNRKERVENLVLEARRPALRLVDQPATILDWPHQPGTVQDTPVQKQAMKITAEIQTKRFHEWDVDSDRYTAQIETDCSSAHALLAALTEAVANLSDFRDPGLAGDQVILQINLRAQPA
jgi:hypothetical protein